MHSLAGIPLRQQNNRTVTPPMPLPLVDSHLPTLDPPSLDSYSEGRHGLDCFNSTPSWTPGWGPAYASSPFRQDQEIHHGLPAIGTISPEQLHPTSQYDMMSLSNEEMGSFTFSDSDGSFQAGHLQHAEDPIASSHRFMNTKLKAHVVGDDAVDNSRSNYHDSDDRHHGAFRQQQQHQHHQASIRRPLPSGRSQNSQGSINSSHGRRLENASVPRNPGIHSQQPQPILRSNKSSTNSTNMSTIAIDSHHPGIVPSSSSTPFAFSALAPVNLAPNPFYAAQGVAIFPPGQDQPGFVPIGEDRVASRAQGNDWPIPRDLMERIIAAERDSAGSHGGSKEGQLTYKQIKAKYSRWRISESTLRGIKRVHDLPKEHRERVPTWNDEHVSARSFFKCDLLPGDVHTVLDPGNFAATLRLYWLGPYSSGALPPCAQIATARHDMMLTVWLRSKLCGTPFPPALITRATSPGVRSSSSSDATQGSPLVPRPHARSGKRFKPLTPQRRKFGPVARARDSTLTTTTLETPHRGLRSLSMLSGARKL